MSKKKKIKYNQIRGYALEVILKHLITKDNYFSLSQEKKLKGRGALHEIDCLVNLNWGIPFIYPLRLIFEAKAKSDKISLNVVRSFLGVMKDIDENCYILPKSLKNSENVEIETQKINKIKYTNCGVIFSLNTFAEESINFAYVHGIFLFDLKPKIELFDRIRKELETKKVLEKINSEYENINKEKKKEKKTLYRDIAFNLFNTYPSPNNSESKPFFSELASYHITFGVLNQNYPVGIIYKNQISIKDFKSIALKFSKYEDFWRANIETRYTGQSDSTKIDIIIPSIPDKDKLLEMNKDIKISTLFENSIIELNLEEEGQKNGNK